MPDPREKRVELILQQLDELPTLPAVALRVLELAGSDAASCKQIVQLVSSDPSISARILQLVHRADSGVRSEIKSVERAVVLLGLDAVRSAVLAISVFENFSPRKAARNGGHFNREEFWKHCVAVACCAELLAERLRQASIQPATAFVCGLLHDLGKVALDAALPKSFSRVIEASELLRGNIADIERQVIGLDHTVVGKRLAEQWSLPAIVRDCIWLHGQDPRAIPAGHPNPRMINLITLADHLVRENHFGFSGNFAFTISRDDLTAAAGLTSKVVDAALEKLPGHIESRGKTLGLGRTTTTELFQQALAQANKELGRISGQLASKNRRLSVKAQFFEALSRFQGDLRPDAHPQVVLRAIGQTGAAVLGVERAASFSIPANQPCAQTLITDADGQMIDNLILDLPRVQEPPEQGAAAAAHPPHPMGSIQLPTPRPGEGPVLTAGEDLDWLTAMVAPRLGGQRIYWICLEADGNCIGGVVWAAEPGEAQRLGGQAQELATLAIGWSLALRTAQIRDESQALAEQLASANRALSAAQGELLRNRTLLSVGEMAAGAAHEMNNPLAVISGRSQLLAAQLDDPRHKAAANLIFDQAHRLSAIISDLMAFARPQPAIIRNVEIAEVVDRAVREAKTRTNSADRKIDVTMGDVPVVAIDAGQATAALVEVIDNAIHATDARTGQIDIHGGYDAYSSRVAITVADNGDGMDEQTLKRAFDPFFSAKRAGRRRGLGLAKAMRWIEAVGGSIRLESRVGHGTRAVILFPTPSERGDATGGATIAQAS